MLLDPTVGFHSYLTKMKMPLIVVFFCISVSSLEAMLQISGHVGGDLSIQCISNRTLNNSSEQYNIYFYKAPCHRENLLIQTESAGPAFTQRGRYSVEGNSTVFKVTIKRLRRTDAGTYCCKLETNATVYSQEINVTVLDDATFPLGPVPYNTTTMEATNFTVAQESLSSSTVPSASVTPSQTSEGSSKEAAITSLKDTTVVIIVSVSLALLVCAIIPLIFYRHWRSTAENQNPAGAHKAGTEHCEENTAIASTQTALTLETLDREAEAEASAHNASQYTAIYQALDPKTLDQV